VLGVALPATVALDHPTLAALSAFLLRAVCAESDVCDESESTTAAGSAARLEPLECYAGSQSSQRSEYGDGKVANREIRVWHFATEKVP
jgi:hypothetical protein